MTNEEAIRLIENMRNNAIGLMLEKKQIDALDMAIEALKAQPIRCKDCKHMEIDNIYHNYWCNGKKVFLNHYCEYAEKRGGV